MKLSQYSLSNLTLRCFPVLRDTPSLPYPRSVQTEGTTMADRKFPDPEAVVYCALAESISDGVLHFEPQMLSTSEKDEELQWLAAYVLVSKEPGLQSHQTGCLSA